MRTGPRNIIYSDAWRPYFYKDFAAFQSVAPFWETVVEAFLDTWPTTDGYNAIKRDLPFEFVVQHTGMKYLREINEFKRIPMRLNSWHDFFNNLSWIIWPSMKAAIIAKFSFVTDVTSKNGRTPLENWLTHFDECGVVICSNREENFHAIEQFEWVRFFLENKNLTKECEMYIVGHGVLEKSLSPYIGMTAKALFLYVPPEFFLRDYREKMNYIDEKLAQHIINLNVHSVPKRLAPFPVLGWPGIWHGNDKEEFFLNTTYFRPRNNALCNEAKGI